MRDIVSTQSKKLVKIALCRSPLKWLDDSVSVHKASQENLKSELAAVIAETCRLGQLF